MARVGEHAVPETSGRGGRFWTAARIMLALTCLTLALHWIQKSPCRDGAWQDLEQYKSFCYTDVLALYYFEGLSEGKVPYFPDDDNHQVEYPVLTGAFMGLSAAHPRPGPTTRTSPGAGVLRRHRAGADAFAVATVAMILSLRRRRPWDAAMLPSPPPCWSPPRSTGTSWPSCWRSAAYGAGPNEIRSRHSRRVSCSAWAPRPIWPAFLLWPIIVLAIRRKDWRPAVFAVGGAAGAWLLTNVPVMLLSFKDWYRFMQLSSEQQYVREQISRRRARDLHRSQSVVRSGRRADLPVAFADHRQYCDVARTACVRRAKLHLPAQPQGQGGAHEGTEETADGLTNSSLDF